MWSILRTLTKFWVSGHLKIRWVLDGYSDRFWGGSGGGSWEPKSIKLALRGQHIRKNMFWATFWVVKKTGQLGKPKKVRGDHFPPEVAALGEGREGGCRRRLCNKDL